MTEAKMNNKKIVEILYTNYKSKTATRKILPIAFYFVEPKYYPDEQWLLVAHHFDKEAEKTFAIKDIKSWQSADNLDQN